MIISLIHKFMDSSLLPKKGDIGLKGDMCDIKGKGPARIDVPDPKGIFSRLFWLVCVCACWAGCILLILSSWESFQNNALSFGTETTYIEWNTSLFAVSVCEESNVDKVYKIGEEMYGEHEYNLIEVLHEISFLKGTSYYIQEFCFGDDPLDCPKSGFKELAMKVRSPCNETFVSCQWNEEEFDCCEFFQVLETELGPCFSLNSIQVKKPKMLPLVSNLKTGPGTLRLELGVQSNVYIHAPEDVPYVNTNPLEVTLVFPDWHKKRRYAITNIVNDEGVKDVSVKQRRCRYPDENDLALYPYYSYTACVVECRRDEHLRKCNCTSHFTPRAPNDTICNLEGLRCLLHHTAKHSRIKSSWSQRPGLVCPCLPGCSEPEYDMIANEGSYHYDSTGLIDLSLNRLPLIRYKRSVVRGRLDLVVSMGGTAGLFVGASLLSFVEFIYFFTIRGYNTLKRERKKEKQTKQKPTSPALSLSSLPGISSKEALLKNHLPAVFSNGRGCVDYSPRAFYM